MRGLWPGTGVAVWSGTSTPQHREQWKVMDLMDKLKWSPWAGQWLEAHDSLVGLITLRALTLHVHSPGQYHGQTLKEIPAQPVAS